MKIGIIGAMQEEIELLKQDMTVLSESSIGMRQYLCGKLYNKEVVLVFSRWGKVASASTATTLIEKIGVDIIIFTGVAGAASKDLNVGDIIVADKLIQHDMDISPLGNIEKYAIPLLGKSYFDVDADYIKMARESALSYIENTMEKEIGKELLSEFHIKSPKVVVGTIASGDHFIADSSKIQELSNSITNLKCVEMEGAAVAQVCFEHDIPFIVVRVISDKADETADIDFSKFINKIASHFTKGIILKLISDLGK